MPISRREVLCKVIKNKYCSILPKFILRKVQGIVMGKVLFLFSFMLTQGVLASTSDAEADYLQDGIRMEIEGFLLENPEFDRKIICIADKQYLGTLLAGNIINLSLRTSVESDNVETAKLIVNILKEYEFVFLNPQPYVNVFMQIFYIEAEPWLAEYYFSSGLKAAKQGVLRSQNEIKNGG